MERDAIIGGRFVLEGRAGAGGFGDVYRARDLSRPGVLVAVKMMRRYAEEDAARFLREAGLLAELGHPGIVRHVAHGQDPEAGLYLAMEWVDGLSLGDRLEAGGLTLRETVAVIRRVAEALGEAHQRGMIHRDLKPDNVMLPRGASLAEAKLIDFGVARRIGQVSQLTRTGGTVGTPAYMAPEQARGLRDIDARADVFALGCMLYECLTAEAPFAAEHEIAVQAKILLAHPAPVRMLAPDVPPALAAFVDVMLAKEREHRPADGTVVAQELAALGELPTVGPPRRRRAVLPAGDAGAAASGPQAGERVVCLILATPQSERDRDANSLVQGALDDVRQRVAPYRAAVEQFSDESVLATVTGDEAAADIATRAARCALLLRVLFPRWPIIMATGRKSPVHIVDALPAAIDRGAQVLVTALMEAVFSHLVPDGHLDAIRLDEATAVLLEPRFEVQRGPKGPVLIRER